MSKNLFNSVQLIKPKKSAFDLSHDVKLTCNLGELVPVMHMDCVPGDKVKLGCESFVRFAPMLAPAMHRLDMSIHYFFVPYRLLWNNWEKFIVNDDTNGLPVMPYFQIYTADWKGSKLPDYFGIPDPVDSGKFHQVSALPFAAYQAIWNDYYRDQNLQPEFNFVMGDGNRPKSELLKLRRRCWEHDYFTASLPFAQKGAAVELPLGTIEIPDAQVYRNTDTSGDNTSLMGTPDSVTLAGRPSSNVSIGNDQMYANTFQSLDVDSVTINELRRAFRLQEWLEKNARAGTRYVENILAHFGVKSSDKRLQRPEYITGVKSPVVISEVLSTFQESVTEGGAKSIPQGNMSGHGISVASGNHGSYFCEEHGIIMGLLSIMPKPAYQDGLEKFFTKTDPLDFYWPAFANIGEQEVLNREVYARHTNPTDVFGYVPRYAEYKFIQNRVCGAFRGNLSYWHFGRQFGSDPALNEEFVVCNPDNRQFAVIDSTVADNLYVHVLNKVLAVRPMPKFGTPTI